MAFQSALGRAVRTGTGARLDDLDLSQTEQTQLRRIFNSGGFRATRHVQRSWCEGRAVRGATLTLSALPYTSRRELVAEWVDLGGGTNSFLAAEALAFLEFIARRVPLPSHALMLCRFEMAVLRAQEAQEHFVAPDEAWLHDRSRVKAGRHANLVVFFSKPDEMIAAIERDEVPRPVEDAIPLLIGPGLTGLVKSADDADVALWQSLREPTTVRVLLSQGHQLRRIEGFFAAGLADLV